MTWGPVLAQFMVVARQRNEAIGLVAAYQANFQDGFAHVAAARFNPYSRSPLMVLGVAVFLQYVFTCWNLRKLAIAETLGVPPGRCVVISGQPAVSESLVAVVELPPGDWAGTVAASLRSNVGPAVGITIHSVPAGAIPRTTSGKPRRLRTMQQIVSGELDSVLIFSSGGGRR